MDTICSPELPRRAFMAVIAGGLLAAPLVAAAQQTAKVYRIGMLERTSPATDRVDLYRRAATHVDKILNAKTAKVLGLTIPPSLLQRADQVIE